MEFLSSFEGRIPNLIRDIRHTSNLETLKFQSGGLCCLFRAGAGGLPAEKFFKKLQSRVRCRMLGPWNLERGFLKLRAFRHILSLPFNVALRSVLYN